MTHESDSNFVPRAPRFEVTDPSEAAVTITRTSGTDVASFAAKLVDVSQHGMKLRVPVNLRFEEALQLEIEVLDTDLEYQGVASVRHIRADHEKNGAESWVIGCAIAPPLSDEAFAYLATTAGKERRRFRRLPIAAEATIRRQTQTEGAAATLHNLSSGGFCFSSEVQYEIGERVQLAIKDTEGKPRVIEARICWQVDGPDGGGIAGCQFSSRSSYAELCACLTEQPVQESSTGHGAEPTSKLILVAAVLAMFVPPMMTLLLQANKVSAEARLAPTTVETFAAVEEELTASLSEPPAQAEPEIDPPLEPRIENQTLETTVSDQADPASEEPLVPAAEQPQLREWVDNTGNYRTQATFVEATAEGVVLQKTNGSLSKVPWRRLSEADREYVKGWQAR